MGFLKIRPCGLGKSRAECSHSGQASTNFFVPRFPVPSSLILHPSSFILHPSSFISHPSSLILHLSSFISHPSSFILYLSSFISHPSSFILYLQGGHRNNQKSKGIDFRDADSINQIQ